MVICRPIVQGIAAEEEGVEVRIEPAEGSVTLRITQTASPMASPRAASPATAIAGNGASSPGAASPLSGSAHSFEHLSQDLTPQPGSPMASDGGRVPSPPSLPDLEALNPSEADGDAPLASSHGDLAASNASICSSADGGAESESCLEASFAEQVRFLQIQLLKIVFQNHSFHLQPIFCLKLDLNDIA